MKLLYLSLLLTAYSPQLLAATANPTAATLATAIRTVPSTINAADLGIKTSGALAADGSWQLSQSGHIGDDFQLVTGKTYNFAINAYGQTADTVKPELQVYADGYLIKKFAVTAQAGSYRFAYLFKSGGTRRIKLALGNPAANQSRRLNLSSLSLSTETAPTTGAVALNVRVQGLGLGKSLTLAHGQASLTAALNDAYRFAPQVAAGAALDLRVSAQPAGQTCAVSSGAPTAVPSDASPVFVRCVYTSAARISMPETLPNKPLSASFDLRESAYPGIAYESRPGVVGGIFPYEYRIKSLTLGGVAQSTAGVSLDFRRGTVRFTPAAEGTYVITLDIKDSGGTQKSLEKSFTIQSAAAKFLFVATDGVDGTGRGTRALPYKTVAYALAQSSASQVLMLRKGTYLTGTFSLRDNHAKQIIAYPDEVVTLDLKKEGTIGVNVDFAPAARLEGLDLTHIKQYGIVSDPSKSGLIVRHVRFLDAEEGSTVGENPAFIHGWGDNVRPWRHKLLVQDNDFGPYLMKSSGAYALTLFDAGDSLIENNQIRLGATTGGIHDKDNSQNNTYRENYIEFSLANKSSRGIHVSAQDNSEQVHIHHNLLVNAGIYLGTQCFQETCYMRDHQVHHNTLANGQVSLNWGPFNPPSYGTGVKNNIISSRTAAPYEGLSCQKRLPVASASKLSTGANLIESTSSLAFKDAECTGNDLSWGVWQTSYGMDTVASGSTVTAVSALVGSGPGTGLPAGDARRTQRGHQYP